MKVGVIGNGYVGGAVAHGFSAASTGKCEVRVYDSIPDRSPHTLEETINKSDFIFIAVPTPMSLEGSINLEYVEEVFKNINNLNKRTDNIFILKSTVTPGTTKNISQKYKNLNIVFNPEFLTEKSARLDFLTQNRVVLGGESEYINKVEGLFKYRFKACHTIKTDTTTAELIKYFSNVFFSVKVSFANEMKLICDSIGANWGEALEGFVADGRVSDSHLNVPGPDGKLGFGGSCFPKDVNAFISFAKKVGVDPNTVEGAWKTNLTVRPEKDWEK